MDKILKDAAKHWSQPAAPGKRRWWQSPSVLQHINRLVCGRAISGPWAGLTERMKQLKSGGFNHGLSVACGNGMKEIRLVQAGVVKEFDLFEISETRVTQGRELAEQHGVSKFVTFHICDAFQQPLGKYDLVYWNNALHHMLDTPKAVKWSNDRLEHGGHFVMDDFVGASRFQWSDFELEMASRFRSSLPERFLRNPTDLSLKLPTEVKRPTIEGMIAADPTEAADSDRIIVGVEKYFPDAEIIFTGGCLYHLGLNDVLAHFDEEADAPWLQAVLIADEMMTRSGATQYAVALAQKKD